MEGLKIGRSGDFTWGDPLGRTWSREVGNATVYLQLTGGLTSLDIL